MSETNSNTNTSPDVTTLISNLLSNPETLSKISTVLSKYTQQENGDNSPPTNDNSENFADNENKKDTNIANKDINSPTEQIFNNTQIPFDLTKIASLFSGGINPRESQNKEQIALLRAIRPYLSPRRQELIDNFIKFSNLGTLLKNFNINGGTNVL
jgi:hypothetical protein